MKSTCINHPLNEPLIKIHRWQVEMCQGNTVAAALMSFFEYWHNIKSEMRSRTRRANDIAEIHGDHRCQDESLLQFHTEKELVEGIMLAKQDKIRQSIRFLEEIKVVSIHKNPNPRYTFDRTRYFLFNPEIVNEWLRKRAETLMVVDPRFIGDGETINQAPSPINQAPSPINQAAITEITPEITPEISKGSLSLTLSLEPEPEEREREFLKPKPKAEELTREESLDPISNLPEPEREEFLKFAEHRGNALPNPPTLMKKWIAANFTELYNQFRESPERRQAKKKAAIETYDWRSDPRFDTWIHEAFNRGVEWIKENEAEREQRHNFERWAMYTNAYEGVCY